MSQQPNRHVKTYISDKMGRIERVEKAEKAEKTDKSDGTNHIREKILHVLKIYPILSPSMLQVGLGPALPSRVWNPILQDLIQEGIVLHYSEEHKHPGGRSFSYAKLRLVDSITFGNGNSNKSDA